jgi:hypothetical protein
LGVLGDALLRVLPWGANFAIWASLFATVILFLGRERRQTFAQGGWWLMLPIALSPLVFLWRESRPLKALSVLALLTALSLALLRAQGGRLRCASLAKYVLGSLIAGANTVFGMLQLLLENPQWRRPIGDARKSSALMRGALLSVPPLVIFGALLLSADAVFLKLFHRIFQFDLTDLLTHLVVIALIAVGVGGYLRGLLFRNDLDSAPRELTLPFSLGAIEAGVMLGSLDLLFLAFVAVQLRYFFGGSALVQATTGLTYAEYCRRGFFELVAVSALVLPFLLFAHWLLRPDDLKGLRLFQWLAGIEILLLFVIMASAFQRMRLYQAEYGLSEQRLYPTAFMGWLAVVFVWFCLTVLRGHREQFAFGAMVAGFLLIAALHAVDPDSLIARTNLARASAGHTFDARYASRLSGDAVPVLISGLSSLNPQDRCELARGLLEHWAVPEDPDWRSWTLSRSQARQAVSANIIALRASCTETPWRDRK